MARRTLTSTWKNFERLVRQYEKSERQDPARVEAIDELIRKSNASRIVEALGTLFINPHGLEDVRVNFVHSTEGQFPEWKTDYDEENGIIWLNIIGVFEFLEECARAAENLNTPEARRTFQHYRYQAYLAQLGKLPSRYILFLLILRQVAEARRITDVEMKGGEIEVAKGEAYLLLLWAFKELEVFFKRTNGLDLRAEFQILWLESDWFVGK